MRIAFKPVTNSPSTADTSSTSKSPGGSFFDILSQGTQDAVQPAKGYGSQAQSNSHSSGQNNSEDSQPQGSAPQTSASADATTSRDQTAKTAVAAGNAAATPRNAEKLQAAPAVGQSNAVKSLGNLLAMANLASTSSAEATASAQAGAASSSKVVSNQAAPSGKQGGTTKGTQSKQDATKGADSGTNPPQQAITLVVPVPVPLLQPVVPQAPLPSKGEAYPAITPQTAAEQAGSQVAATAALAAQNAALSAADPTSAQATNSPSQQVNSQASDAQRPSQVGPAGATAPFQHDLVASAANAAKTSTSELPPPATAGTAQGTAQNLAQGLNLTVASTFSPMFQQNDTVTNQTASKVNPFKVTGTNSGANTAPNTAAASANTAATTNASASVASAAAAAKSGAQDSANSSAHNGPGNSDAGANTQPANAVRAMDASTTQAALGSFAAAHATAQAGPTTLGNDAAPTHAGSARSLPSDPAEASLPAGSSAINSARVIQSMNETEMRVGMRSAEFGDISIRTTVTQQQVQAQISVDHSELVNALAAHIPAAQAKIGADYGLHASIEVSQGGASFNNSSQQQQQAPQQEYKPFAASMPIDGNMSLIETDRPIARPMAAAAIVDGSRLDIRA